jgi:hypothetical protein
LDILIPVRQLDALWRRLGPFASPRGNRPAPIEVQSNLTGTSAEEISGNFVIASVNSEM